MKGNIFLLIFILTQNLYGQDSSITGIAIYEKSLTTVDSLKVDLLDSLKTAIQTVYTDSQGVYRINEIASGKYNLHATLKNGKKYLYTGISIEEAEDITLDIEIQFACANQDKTNKCPYCSSTKKVLKINPGMVISYNFGDNKSAIKRYDRKRRKSKYETYVTEENEEVVISMSIKSEKEKFYDFCHHWFCKKCEKVY